MSLAGYGRALVVVGLACQAPLAWAQPLDVADVDVTRAAVETQVERLVMELATRDPELAQEIERQAELCERDMRDGQLDHEGLTRDIENFREVRELMERGEFSRPTPEMMERMQTEMERVFAERPELAEYARAEFSEFAREGMEMFGREMGEHGPSPEDMERMMAEGHSPEDMARMMETFREMGGPEQFRDMDPREMAERFGHESEQFRELDREQFEREFGDRLDLLAEQFGSQPPPPPLEGGGGGEHALVEVHTIAEHGHPEGHWDGSDPDLLPDHTHPPETPPHSN